MIVIVIFICCVSNVYKDNYIKIYIISELSSGDHLSGGHPRNLIPAKISDIKVITIDLSLEERGFNATLRLPFMKIAGPLFMPKKDVSRVNSILIDNKLTGAIIFKYTCVKEYKNMIFFRSVQNKQSVCTIEIQIRSMGSPAGTQDVVCLLEINYSKYCFDVKMTPSRHTTLKKRCYNVIRMLETLYGCCKNVVCRLEGE